MTLSILDNHASKRSSKKSDSNNQIQHDTVCCRIIGVLDDAAASLSAQALNYIKQANIVIGGSRTLKLFECFYSDSATQMNLKGNIAKIPMWIKSAREKNQQVVLLATGDPLCHGIAKYITKNSDPNTWEILPNVSTIQLACARIGLAWQDLKICSVHSKDTGEWQIGSDPSHSLYFLLQQLQQHDTVVIFTSPENSPDRISRMLKLEGFEHDFKMTVVENILQENENTIENLDIETASNKAFSDLNITVLFRTSNKPVKLLFGNADTTFAQRKPDKGLITKREVRAVSLARMQLQHNSIIWDIGAGSGAVGLEAARLSPNGHVYAIEKNQPDYLIASQNKLTMHVTNYTLVNAKAPEWLASWPNPDAIFIGGSGGELTELIKICVSRMRPDACLVMNFVTFENIACAIETLKKLAQDGIINWDATQLSAARSKPILHMNRLQAENPVCIITAQKIVAGKNRTRESRT